MLTHHKASDPPDSAWMDARGLYLTTFWLTTGQEVFSMGKELSVAETAYLAGMIDGEGCIFISETRGRYFELRLVTAGTGEDHIRACAEMAGVGSIHHAPGSGKRADKWQWIVMAKEAADLLRQLMPYLLLKDEQARLALRFQHHMANSPAYNRWHPIPESVLRYRRKLADAMKELKQDGKVFDGITAELEAIENEIPQPKLL